jgi:hypothetical protein
MWELGLAHLSVGTSSPTVTTGKPFNVSVTVLDPLGSKITSYAGTIHFTSTDTSATLPLNYTFLPSDSGKHIFTGVILRTLGSQTITATDTTNNSITGSATVTVRGALNPLIWHGPANWAQASTLGTPWFHSLPEDFGDRYLEIVNRLQDFGIPPNQLVQAKLRARMARRSEVLELVIDEWLHTQLIS